MHAEHLYGVEKWTQILARPLTPNLRHPLWMSPKCHIFFIYSRFTCGPENLGFCPITDFKTEENILWAQSKGDREALF